MSFPESVAYIHHYLDEYGLDVYEFRVYAHIIRRTGGKLDGEAFPSLDNIACCCQISKRKAQEVLLMLESFKMIYQVKTPRRSNTWKITHSSNWVPSNQLQSIRDRIRSEKKESSRERKLDALLSSC